MLKRIYKFTEQNNYNKVRVILLIINNLDQQIQRHFIIADDN